MNVNTSAFDWFNWNKRRGKKKKKLLSIRLKSIIDQIELTWLYDMVYQFDDVEFREIMISYCSLKYLISILNEWWYCIAWTFIQPNLLDNDDNGDDINESRYEYSTNIISFLLLIYYHLGFSFNVRLLEIHSKLNWNMRFIFATFSFY